MSVLVLAIRFLWELAALATLAIWGAHTAGVPLAVATPLAAGLAWGAWVAPRARNRLHDPARFIVESTVWIGATLALVDLDRRVTAIAFAVVAFATAAGARRYEPEVRNLDSSSRRNA